MSLPVRHACKDYLLVKATEAAILEACGVEPRWDPLVVVQGAVNAVGARIVSEAVKAFRGMGPEGVVLGRRLQRAS